MLFQSLKLAALMSFLFFSHSRAITTVAPRTMHPSQHPAVVQLFIGGGMCTGWVVAKNRIATASHCFGHPKLEETEGTAIFQNGRVAPVKLLKAGHSNTGTDVAIALVDTRDITPIRLRPRNDWRPEFCYFVGFGGYLGKNEMPCYAIKLDVEEAGLVVVLHGEVIPGDSGGPIFGKDGDAIGLTFAYATTMGDTGFGVPSWIVQEYLNATIPHAAY